MKLLLIELDKVRSLVGILRWSTTAKNCGCEYKLGEL
jgi:hypothetical protein